MSKAKVFALIALAMMIVDVFVNFSFAMMNTMYDAGVLFAAILAAIMMRKENK